MGTDQRRNRAVGIEDAGRVALGTADADFVQALNGVATIAFAAYRSRRLVGQSLRRTSREGGFLRNVEENTLVIVESYPVFAKDGAARTTPHERYRCVSADLLSRRGQSR